MIKKKMLSLLLAIAMTATMLSGAVFAEGEIEAVPSEETSQTVAPHWNDAKTMYFDQDGNAVKGVQKIGGKLYFFNKTTGIAAKKGFFSDQGYEYYSLNNSGQLATGWQALYRGKSLNGYYFSKTTARMAKNTTIGHLKIPKSGRLHEAYAHGIRVLNKKGWSLRAAYKYSYKLKYYDRWYRVKGAKKSERYSLRGFKKKKGNCFVMASTFYVMAKLLGYDIRQVQGKIGRWPHSWTEIKKNGKKRVYDPNFQNEKHRNGWNIYYGKKGTWRYSKKKKYLNKFTKAGNFK